MPFITYEQLESIIGVALAGQLCADPQAFEAAERSAAQIITQRTGIAEPALGDETTAPAWVQMPAAHIILYKNLGRLGRIDTEFRQWAADLYSASMASLDEHKIQTPSGRATGSHVGSVEGLTKW